MKSLLLSLCLALPALPASAFDVENSIKGQLDKGTDTLFPKSRLVSEQFGHTEAELYCSPNK